MQETVITIVGPLSRNKSDQASLLIRSLGVEVSAMKILKPERAVDIFLPTFKPELSAKIYQKFEDFGPFDVFVQQQGDDRRKRLLVADMDATIVVGETLDELAGHFGLKDKVSAITEKAMRGEIDFHEALRQRVAMLQGLPVSDAMKTVEGMELSAGAAALVKTMKRQGARCVLISGGFEFFTARAAELCGFDRHLGNRLDISNGKLTGEVMPPIVDKETKKKILIEECRALGIATTSSLGVGDGANDIPMLKTAGAGVGYYAKPAVQQEISLQIKYTDLVSLLYMQGYGVKDIGG